MRLGNAFVEPGTQQTQAPVQLQLREGANYTQQQAEQLIQQNTKEQNDALMRLAGKLVEQQEATQGQREAIRATLPQQEQKLVFTRSLHIDQWAPLELDLKLERASTDVSAFLKLGLLLSLVIGFGLLILASTARNKTERDA